MSDYGAGFVANLGQGIINEANSPLKREHPALSRSALGFYAAQTAIQESYDCRKARRKNMSRMLVFYQQTDRARLAISEGVGEMFGYRLAEVAGVRVPRVTLTTNEPSEAEFKSNHVKSVPGGWMLSERVPASIPIYYLRGSVRTSALSEHPEAEESFRPMFKAAFDKRCPLGREAYADFPSEPPQEALDAARWDSEQRLRHYAYRALLGCTYPHSSNVLVNTSGRLWLIDHEKCCVSTEGDDSALLLEMIADSPQALAVCRRVAREITPEAIERSLDGIPDNFWRPGSGRKRYARRDNPEGAARYFIDRLNRWNELFNEERRMANAS